eukprot:scaffold1328_cov394-Prasinococcus_capsulatus_cf.AAC.48
MMMMMTTAAKVVVLLATMGRWQRPAATCASGRAAAPRARRRGARPAGERSAACIPRGASSSSSAPPLFGGGVLEPARTRDWRWRRVRTTGEQARAPRRRRAPPGGGRPSVLAAAIAAATLERPAPPDELVRMAPPSATSPPLLRALVVHADTLLDDSRWPAASCAPSSARGRLQELLARLASAQLQTAVVSTSAGAARVAAGVVGELRDAMGSPPAGTSEPGSAPRLAHLHAATEGAGADGSAGASGAPRLPLGRVVAALGRAGATEVCELRFAGAPSLFAPARGARCASVVVAAAGEGEDDNEEEEDGEHVLVRDLLHVQHALARLNKRRKPDLLVVGYAMRASRARKLQRLGALLQLDPRASMSCVPLRLSPEARHGTPPGDGGAVAFVGGSSGRVCVGGNGRARGPQGEEKEEDSEVAGEDDGQDHGGAAAAAEDADGGGSRGGGAAAGGAALAVDVMLHKVTDELLDDCRRSPCGQPSPLRELRLRFSPAVAALQSQLASPPPAAAAATEALARSRARVLWLDELERVAPLLGRDCLQQLGASLDGKWRGYPRVVRMPKSTALLHDLQQEYILRAMEQARLACPCILKVRRNGRACATRCPPTADPLLFGLLATQSAAAAGVNGAHTMALLAEVDTRLDCLGIRLPAVLQVRAHRLLVVSPCALAPRANRSLRRRLRGCCCDRRATPPLFLSPRASTPDFHHALGDSEDGGDWVDAQRARSKKLRPGSKRVQQPKVFKSTELKKCKADATGAKPLDVTEKQRLSALCRATLQQVPPSCRQSNMTGRAFARRQLGRRATPARRGADAEAGARRASVGSGGARLGGGAGAVVLRLRRGARVALGRPGDRGSQLLALVRRLRRLRGGLLRGRPEALRAARGARARRCVVKASAHPEARRSLAVAGVAGHVHAVVLHEQVARGPPPSPPRRRALRRASDPPPAPDSSSSNNNSSSSSPAQRHARRRQLRRARPSLAAARARRPTAPVELRRGLARRMPRRAVVADALVRRAERGTGEEGAVGAAHWARHGMARRRMMAAVRLIAGGVMQQLQRRDRVRHPSLAAPPGGLLQTHRPIKLSRSGVPEDEQRCAGADAPTGPWEGRDAQWLRTSELCPAHAAWYVLRHSVAVRSGCAPRCAWVP